MSAEAVAIVVAVLAALVPLLRDDVKTLCTGFGPTWPSSVAT